MTRLNILIMMDALAGMTYAEIIEKFKPYKISQQRISQIVRAKLFQIGAASSELSDAQKRSAVVRSLQPEASVSTPEYFYYHERWYSSDRTQFFSHLNKELNQ